MRALISVANKEGIESFARALHARGCEIISTGGTAAALAAADVPAQSVSDLTGFPEILGGRVKTLHPAVHGGILARRDNAAHMNELRAHGIEPIDVVVCNLYRFAATMARSDATLEEVLEEIDIGGVTLLRAAAKNFPYVTVIVRPRDYTDVLRELDEGGSVMAETRRWLAAVAFQHTAIYDSLIAEYLRRGTAEAAFPEEVTVPMRRLQMLRYGENPHQQGALYTWGVPEAAPGPGVSGATHSATAGNGASKRAHATAGAGSTPPTVAGASVLHGKELGFNNILDLDTALGAAASFIPPTAVIIKHTNPCGLACGDTLLDAYKRAHTGDPVSAYGGIVGFNREVDEATATELAQIFYEAIIAPGYSPAALETLRQKKNLRLLATGTPIGPAAVSAPGTDLARLDVRRVSGGILLQTPDVISDKEVQCTVVTEREPTLEEVTDLLFAWKAVQHVKSNAIVLAKKLTVVGVGAGQTNRVFSVEIAVQKAVGRARGSVLASDAYFPFPDGVEAACKAGVTAIIQPGGSIRDAEAIRMANRYGVAMVTTGQRHFRH
jgi:phosphoribosylaminoimidazolecarboxamide formyltransferase/IMP cyclohydrolase